MILGPGRLGQAVGHGLGLEQIGLGYRRAQASAEFDTAGVDRLHARSQRTGPAGRWASVGLVGAAPGGVAPLQFILGRIEASGNVPCCQA